MIVINKDILERYLAGLCTPEERQSVEDWYFKLGNVSSAPLHEESFAEEEVFLKIQNSMAGVHASTLTGKLRPRRTLTPLLATFLVVVAAAGWWFFVNRAKAPDLQLTNSVHLQFSNTLAFTSKQLLPDGSTVWLSPGSSIEYNKNESTPIRNVVLMGEAFFEVVRDSLHPFVIQTGEMETRVLGTSFNLTAIPQSKTYKVSVVTGKVQVSAKDNKGVVHAILLQPKQQSSFNVRSSELAFVNVSEKVIKTQYWKPFTLSFEDASMEEVKTQLENAFAIKVRFQNKSLSNCRLRANFTNEKLPQIMNVIEKLLDVTCVLDENDILSISGEGCPE